MITYNQIKHVHLEISSLCNARCPLCPRNFRGYPFNDGYIEKNLSLSECKKIFKLEFLKQLSTILINGNLGDPMMNPEIIQIIDYFRQHNNNITIYINTNGSIRNNKFWQEIGKKNIVVQFHIDGLEDTNHLYRQNTDFKKIIKNAKSYISAGGRAVWAMVKFQHNEHQIEQCKKLSEELKFFYFQLLDDGRNTGPVYDTNGKLVHVMGDYQGETNFEILFHKKKTDLVLLEDIIDDRKPKKTITCWAKTNSSIYIDSNGLVSPCCKTGFSPKTFGHGEYFQAANKQLADIIYQNNALEYSLEECIEWFHAVENAWSISDYKQGRLVICDDVCGSN